METREITGVVVRQAVRVAKYDDEGRCTEIVCADSDGRLDVVTPESDPEEWARLCALEQAGADAE